MLDDFPHNDYVAPVLVDQTKSELGDRPNQKSAIATSFDKAAGQYNAHAQVQQSISQHALKQVESMVEGEKVNCLADIGCGTASAMFSLSQYAKKILGVDISPQMLKTASVDAYEQDIDFIPINADAEALGLQTNTVDFIYSSMALQWCESPELALRNMDRVLKKNGKGVLAILTGESFSDLHEAWDAQGLPSRLNKFHTANKWLSAAKTFNWQVDPEQTSFFTFHSSIVDLLKSVKRVGADVLINQDSQYRDNNKSSQKDKETPRFIRKHELKCLHRYLQNKQCGEASRQLALDYNVLFLKIIKQ